AGFPEQGARGARLQPVGDGERAQRREDARGQEKEGALHGPRSGSIADANGSIDWTYRPCIWTCSDSAVLWPWTMPVPAPARRRRAIQAVANAGCRRA